MKDQDGHTFLPSEGGKPEGQKTIEANRPRVDGFEGTGFGDILSIEG